MDTPSHRPLGTASDSLMTQIHVDNVLQVHGVLASEADAIEKVLFEANWMRNIPRCADDPISINARDAFQKKIDQILDVHQAHHDELTEAVVRLRQAAREYEFTDDEVLVVFNGYREQFGLPLLSPPDRQWSGDRWEHTR